MTRFNSAIVISAVITALCTSTSSKAEPATNASNDPLLKITVTGTRNEEKVLDYPGSVNVYNRGDLEKNPKTNLRDLFNEIPGVQTTEGIRSGVR